mgnify:CR=1 FL=1
MEGQICVFQEIWFRKEKNKQTKKKPFLFKLAI